MISANDLRKIQLTETQTGYSVDEVKTVIDEAASTIEGLENENKELYRKMEVLAAKIEEYRSEEDSIKTALIMAQKMADKVKKESNEEAEKLIADSRAQADSTVSEANTKAEKIVSEAREFSSSMINQKTDEANAILADAEKKSNDAINSSKIVAQNILDQAKEISDDLVKKSQEEKEAYELLIQTLRRNAASFIDNLKVLYNDQLDSLSNAKLYSENAENESNNLSSVKGEVASLVGEIDEMKSAIPEEIKLEKNDAPKEENAENPFESAAPAVEENPVTQEVEEEPVQVSFDVQPNGEFELITDDAEEDVNPMSAVEAFSANEEPQDSADPMEAVEAFSANETIQEPADPMEAVEAFTADEITPIDKSKKVIPVINEEAKLEDEAHLEEKLPFENYFHVKKDDAHFDKTQTISLVPPDDEEDDEDSFDRKHKKGFFKKKK